MIAWSFEELQKHIDEICSGEKLVSVDQSQTIVPLYIVFKYPNRQTVRMADIYVDKTVRRAKSENILTEAEMDSLMRKKGIWTDDDDLKVESINKLIAMRKRKIADPEIDATQKPYIQDAINKLEQELFTAELKRERMMMNTAERIARQEKYDFLTWACSYNPETDSRIWESYNNYLTYCKDVDKELKGRLLNEFLKFLVGHSTEEIRYTARNNIWRIDYMVAQAGGMHLLPTSPLNLTPDQKNLIWWTKYYQSIYEMLPDDQPEDYIIEDDEELDKYMEDLHKERSQERASKRAERRYGPSTAMNMAERLVMQSHPDYLQYEYDKVNPHAEQDRADINLNDDPRMQGAAFKKSQQISASRRYSPS